MSMYAIKEWPNNDRPINWRPSPIIWKSSPKLTKLEALDTAKLWRSWGICCGVVRISGTDYAVEIPDQDPTMYGEETQP